jgi:hypothetical protein
MRPVKRYVLVTVLAGGLSLPGCYSSFDQGQDPSPPPGGAVASRSASGVAGESGEGASAAPDQSGAAAGGQEGKEDAEEKEEKKQSYEEAWELICDAERLSGADPSAPAGERGATVAKWIVNNIENKRARYWFIELGSAKEEEKAERFQAEARRAGQEQCPLYDLLFADSEAATGAGSYSGPGPDQKPSGTSP